MADGQRWVVAGLGNPGPWFAGTRHNAGFLVVDHLAARHGVRLRRRALRASVATVSSNGSEVVLAQPRWCSINFSGGPVGALLRVHEVAPERLLVVQDDLDFPFGTARLKRGGSAAGHNGVRSVHRAVPGREWLRLRVGIGRPAKGESVGSHVLGRFTAQQQEQLPALLERCADAVEALLAHGLGAAQRTLHTTDS